MTEQDIPPHPLICEHEKTNVAICNTLEKAREVLAFLCEQDSSGLSEDGQMGLYWVHSMLLSSMEYTNQLANGKPEKR